MSGCTISASISSYNMPLCLLSSNKLKVNVLVLFMLRSVSYSWMSYDSYLGNKTAAVFICVCSCAVLGV